MGGGAFMRPSVFGCAGGRRRGVARVSASGSPVIGRRFADRSGGLGQD